MTEASINEHITGVLADNAWHWVLGRIVSLTDLRVPHAAARMQTKSK